MKYGKLLIPLLLLATPAAAQELPRASAFVLHHMTFAAQPAPDFSVSYFRPETFHVERTVTPTQWEAVPPVSQPRPLNIPMLRTLQRNRLVATIAGGIPALARAFDDDAATKRRFDIGPMIDIDDGRIGVRVKIRLSE
jgi:hypothetical protein